MHTYMHRHTEACTCSLTGVELVDSYYRKNAMLTNIADVVNEVAGASF